jgi:hypothetical protein
MFHGSRRGEIDGVTPTTQKNIVAAIEEAITAWAETTEAQRLLAEAELAWANNEVYRQREKLLEAKAALDNETAILHDKTVRLFEAQAALEGRASGFR